GGSTDPVFGDHTYPAGAEVAITAISDDGWEFVDWSGDVDSTDSVVTITMDADKEITASFQEIDDGGVSVPLISGLIVAGLVVLGTFFFFLIGKRRKKKEAQG
ncbi:MAG: hypothetical protein SVM79_07230, partial [Chloroflexota bacterium]|nr:hypothetical protein [Chloroflexota bacterium]